VIVYTLGHSTLALEAFVALVRAHGILGIADVRRFPASRRHPHFAREALGGALAAAGIAYTWLPGLGGRRTGPRDSRHVAWQSAAFRAYADHMETAEFQIALDGLLELARERPTAILCAEAVPWRCHRQLIADALLVRGIEVRHVIGHGPPSGHRLTGFARVVDDRLIYDRGQLALP